MQLIASVLPLVWPVVCVLASIIISAVTRFVSGLTSRLCENFNLI